MTDHDQGEVEALADYFTHLDRSLSEFRAAVSRGIGGAARAGVPGAAIDKLVRPGAEALLRADELGVVGAGFVSGDRLFGDGRGYIAWWQVVRESRVDAIGDAGFGPADRYARYDWFQAAVANPDDLAVTGPYIDLLCTDDFILTLTRAVVAAEPDGGAGPVGVVGLDVTIEGVERRARTALRRLGERSALLRADGRVVAARSPLLLAGDFAEVDAGSERIAVGPQLVLVSSARPA
ncbi:hypothetical protein [Tsukamurella spumae]|uniref:Cache domain-containing protein n=1 Tax=Tsukamurella spumae TaxID=44753 RepID=A0A846X828_9ACTN|nr:hypothetical protein [Tsukamurella spumae]NKY19890.1 hypothetical protein [Tsukamurella spumae]